MPFEIDKLYLLNDNKFLSYFYSSYMFYLDLDIQYSVDGLIKKFNFVINNDFNLEIDKFLTLLLNFYFWVRIPELPNIFKMSG